MDLGILKILRVTICFTVHNNSELNSLQIFIRIPESTFSR